jgi:hypothetical protein
MIKATIDGTITLTDEAMDELVAAVAARLKVDTPTPQPAKGGIHFGYFGAPNVEFIDHVTYQFAPGWDGGGLPLNSPTVLFSPFGDPLDAALQTIKKQGGLHHIIALYPQDEPDVAGLDDAQATAKFKAARDAAKAVGIDVPIMCVYGSKGYPGVGAVDIVGHDNYGRGPLVPLLVRNDQKVVYVSGGCNPWREAPVAFVDAAMADPRAWGVINFIWLDQWGGTQHLGIRSNGTAGRHREAYGLIKAAHRLPAVASVEPKPVDPPKPIDPPKPTERFDEAWYLKTYPDVAAAIPKYFASGWDHYDKAGRAEGRKPYPPISPPVPPVEPPKEWVPADQYANRAIARAVFAQNQSYSQIIMIDGQNGFPNEGSRFGPPLNYYTWPDGSVRQERPAKPIDPPKPPDPEVPVDVPVG